MRRGAIVRIVLVGVVIAIIQILVAVLIPWLPDSASKQMDRIEFIYWFATVISIAIFALVMAVLLYSVYKFRSPPEDESDGPSIHGHTGLEIAWTVVPAILVIAIGVISAVVLSQNGNAGTNPMTIKVFAQQFAWRFEYPGEKNLKSNELVDAARPEHHVRASSRPTSSTRSGSRRWGRSRTSSPGSTRASSITPTRLGNFTLICTELCGLGHATMRAPASVVSQADFDAWVKKKQSGAGGGGGSGKAVFASAGCGGCHAFTPAGTNGAIGPKLDNVAADARRPARIRRRT